MDIRSYIKQLDQLMKEYNAIYHMAAVAYGLSDTALWILYIVSDAAEPCTQQDLCRQCCFPKQTINTAINHLIRDGYLTLETLPGTRNSKRIMLTDTGRALMQTTTDQAAEYKPAGGTAGATQTENTMKTPIQLSDHFTYRRLFRFTLPSIASMIFASVYGIVDGYFVSNYAGKIPFAGLNILAYRKKYKYM